MKLGIIVVYLFDANSEFLLDLHVGRIRKFTDVDYIIYGSVNRLIPERRRKLSKYPEIRQCEIPPTDLRLGLEHGYYLDRLAEIAIQNGATHVVSLHLDSFPVCLGWVQKLKSFTDQSETLVAIDDAYTACLFFTRDFYLRYRPKFNLDSDPKYLEFIKEKKIIGHSGAPYFYTCHTHRLPWRLLGKTSSKTNCNIGDVYGGMIFHLGNAIRLSSEYLDLYAKTAEIKTLKGARRWIVNMMICLNSIHFVNKTWIFVKSIFFKNNFDKWLRNRYLILESMKVESNKKKLAENLEDYFVNIETYVNR